MDIVSYRNPKLNKIFVVAHFSQITREACKSVPKCLDIDSTLLCIICHQVAIKPVSCTECMSSIFCHSCISHWVQTQPSCPTCRCAWKKTTNNLLAQQFIDKLAACCVFCEFNDNYANCVKHMATCLKRIVKCSYKGCNKKMEYEQISNHEQECVHATQICKCKAVYKKSEKEVFLVQ